MKTILITLLLFVSLFATQKTFAQEVLPENSSDFVGPVAPTTTPQISSTENGFINSFFNSSNDLKIAGVTLDKSLIKPIYANLGNRTIWFENNALTTNAKKALKFLSLAESNGIDPKDINAKLVQKRLDNSDPQKIANTDLLITHLVSKMINQIANGRVTPQEAGIIESYNLSVNKIDVSNSVQEFLQADNIEEFINKYSPKYVEYQNLKTALAKLIEERDSRSETYPKIKAGPDILPGGRDYRIVDIKRRFGSPSTLNTRAREDKFIYYKELQSHVMEFQKKFGIKPTGVINNKTVQALNVDENDLIKKISVNMDRLRWLPATLEDKRLMINVAAQRLKAYEGGKEIFTQALVIGRSEKKTALMNTSFINVVFNPYWHAPRGYTLQYLVPIIKNDLSYLKTEEIDAIRFAPDGRWVVVDPKTIDWKSITDKNLDFMLRQRPGKRNALGPMKFSLVNNFDIYMHGTSEPWLFSSDYRAQSSGCIRVEDPIKLALYSLLGNTDVPEEKFMSYYEAFNDDKLPPEDLPKQVTVALKNPIPTYINYQTVLPDEKGNLNFVDDIYGWDTGMLDAIKNPIKSPVKSEPTDKVAQPVTVAPTATPVEVKKEITPKQ